MELDAARARTAEAAVAQLRPSLESDGFALTVEETGADGSVVVCLEALPGACEDCLVPDDVLVSILDSALRESMSGFTGVRLLRRGFDSTHPAEGAPVNARTVVPSESAVESSPAADHTDQVPIAVHFEGVTMEFAADDDEHRRTVLSEVSIDVPTGQFLVLVGKSGCGKTTILNMIAGLLEPTYGVVRVLDDDARAARSKVGYMFARDALMPWRSAAHNIEYGLELRKVNRRERRARSARYLDLVGLGQVAGLWPWQLSQGMRQRVAIARTLALEPELLLLDEPFAALDANTRETIQAEFLTLWERDLRTVVFVTHDLTEALLLADRVIVVGQGRILADVAVNLARPRDITALGMSAEFQQTLQRLRHVLNSDD